MFLVFTCNKHTRKHKQIVKMLKKKMTPATQNNRLQGVISNPTIIRAPVPPLVKSYLLIGAYFLHGMEAIVY